MDPVDLHRFSYRDVGERGAGELLNGAVGGGNRVAMGIDVGMAQCGGHPLDHSVGDRVLQPLGLVVHRIPGVAQKFDQIGLDEAVPANHPQGRPPALLGQLDPAIGDMLQEAVLRQPFDHAA